MSLSSSVYLRALTPHPFQDLKSGNILVEESGLCKIANFGISKQADDIDLIGSHTSMQGSVFWMAPEVVDIQKKGHYNSKIDIWSVGCVVLEMWTGERPWSGREQYTVLFQVCIRSTQLPGPSSLNPFLSSTRQKPALHCQKALNCLLRLTIFVNVVLL